MRLRRLFVTTRHSLLATHHPARDENVRVLFQEGFVNTAEFLGADVLVVNGAADFVLLGEGQGADGLEEFAVGELGVVEVGRGFVRPEEAAQLG
jgi:hypothetical protein